jgi:phospholipase/carboxylesterase
VTVVISDLSLHYLAAIPSRQPQEASMPLVVMIHGRGADAHDLADLAPLLDTPSGCRFIFPNAPEPFEAYPGMTFGWTWFDGWPPIHESVAASRERLMQFLGEITARYPTPPGRIVIAGFSQGAMMALDAGLRLDPKPAGIVAMSGGLYDADLPDLQGRNSIRTLLAHGTDDDVVSVTYSRKARATLEAAGFEVEYHEFPMAHQVVQEEIDAARAFLARVLS